ncbi:6-hydroxy-D-nicotine oxidase [Achaetomium macrosporum]|uniref:6-hydroxy-D-nicotine oxidase n=1 Tax=Achaetomium macrosporum TaxID=79813 RepID=A0AAN7CBB0_9PEZI|nr:6-hydroxy-D-nicotine oxidase [Achaetomium macrosporum]
MARKIHLVGLAIASIFSHAVARDTQAHAYPLFEYETNFLTEEGLQRLIYKAGVVDNAHLFAFDDGTDGNPDRLRSGSCKAFPGDADWPSPSTWRTFDKLLDGALIQTLPVAAPCYRNLGVYDAEKCAAVQNSFTNPYFHENDPTSIFWPLFQGRTCMPTDDPNSGNCTHGGYPVYAVNVSNVGHIQLAVNFARNANLRLSSGAGALSIWTHGLKDLRYYAHLEIPGYAGPAMKVGAGVTVREVYAEAHRTGGSALGGICESVGYAGGYIAGGGHTPISGPYGMATDHVMALEVVTADGRFITASPEEHTDLHWALRGGGGSTFGVVTSLIIRVHPKIPITTSTFSFSTSATVSADTFWRAMHAYFSLFIPFTDAGTYSCTSRSFTFTMDPFFAPNHTPTSFHRLVAPWFNTLTSLGMPLSHLTTTAHPDFYTAYNATWGRNTLLNSAGRISVPGNRLLPRRNWESPALFATTFAAIRTHSESGRLLHGYHQAPRNRAGAGADNAVNPAFREVICFLILSGRFKAVAPDGVEGGGGAYLNEANVDEPDRQGAFYGGNYGRLLEVKRAWDPGGLGGVFYATTVVGSEA